MDLRKDLVVCIGSPMIDVTARVPYDFLQKYNLKPNSATSFNQDCSKIFEDLEEYGPKFSIGGSITNTVISAQRVLRSFHMFCYIGVIGKDDFGTKIRQTLGSLGVNALFQETNDHVLLYRRDWKG
ncbi:hypothetical protein AMK59_4637 [Oryctes borbonicus]|uniref:Adenosine kinase n=1 Tax=Oryctes borbonicus TaxID=1629725 RepID=A0A0T6B7D4_9SCAR|nr:hypothetical protein AMK59_4637 [Oryctes borbonicus]